MSHKLWLIIYELKYYDSYIGPLLELTKLSGQASPSVRTMSLRKNTKIVEYSRHGWNKGIDAYYSSFMSHY